MAPLSSAIGPLPHARTHGQLSGPRRVSRSQSKLPEHAQYSTYKTQPASIRRTTVGGRVAALCPCAAKLDGRRVDVPLSHLLHLDRFCGPAENSFSAAPVVPMLGSEVHSAQPGIELRHRCTCRMGEAAFASDAGPSRPDDRMVAHVAKRKTVREEAMGHTRTMGGGA